MSSPPYAAARGHAGGHARRPRTSSPTSSPATRTRRSTRSGASSQITNEAGERRPATLKTGTNNDAKDLNAYGFIAPPTRGGPGRRRVRPGGRRLERQQRQLPGLDARGAGLLDRGHDIRLAGLPERSYRDLGDQRLRRAGRSRPRRGRCLDRHQADDREPIRRGGVHRRDRADAARSRSGVCGSAVFEYTSFEKNHRELAAGRPELVRAGATWPRDRRRRQRHADRVLLQRPVQALRQLVGHRRGLRLQGHRAVADVHPVADARTRAA